jgi:hypothetical protein
MDTVIRHVHELDAADRREIERVIGQSLSDDQQVLLRAMPSDGKPSESSATNGAAAGQWPEWCNIFYGLSEPDIDEVDSVIRHRADLTRPSE